MSDRFCARCDQPVEELPKGKEWTTSTEVQGEYRHKKTHKDGVPYCGRQFLAEHETYTEADGERYSE